LERPLRGGRPTPLTALSETPLDFEERENCGEESTRSTRFFRSSIASIWHRMA
jgi:hypothetical protein